MKPGVYDLSIEDYHNGPGISRSGLKEYKRSPLHYKHKYILENNDTPKTPIITKRDALGFGNAFHTYILEKDKFNEEYSLIKKVNRATTKGKEEYHAALEKAGDRKLVDMEAFELIQAMHSSLIEHPHAPSFIGNSLYEKSIYWEDDSTGLLCKARPDVWNKGFICDLKTAADASESAFSRAIYNFGYHIQCGMIYNALKKLYNIEMKNFAFVVVEKEPPYAVAVYTLDEEDLMRGVEEASSILSQIKESFDTDDWPSYPTQTISLPKFAKREAEL